MRVMTMLWLLVLSGSLYAEVYKCELKGNVVFSDRPCADNAEKVEINVYQPKAEDIAKQRNMTQDYQQESNYVEMASLRSQNERLKKQITALQKQHDVELKALQDKTYQYSGKYVATREPGLFKRMRALTADFQARIQRLQAQIDQNETQITQIGINNQ